jgi:Flp pilus assembly protein TadG
MTREAVADSAGGLSMQFFSAVRKLVGQWPSFRTSRRGNVTTTFALATIPLVGFVGAAVDYSHANSVKAAMQAAVDSTALMMSKQAAGMSQTEIQPKAEAYFKALFNRPEADAVAVNASYTTGAGSKIVVTATAALKTNFMGLMGVSQMPIRVESMAKWGNTKLRVALALDTTGSMIEAGKIDALKTATKSLLKQLKAAAATDGDVYAAIVPFSKDVNFGQGYYKDTSIRWDLWEELNGSCSKKDWSVYSKTDCLAQSGNPQWTPDNHITWNGCITDRDQDYDTKNATPNINVQGTLFPAEQYGACPAQLTPLTYDWTALNSKVDDLYPSGNTNQGIGIAWAFQALTAAPFTVPPKDPNYKYTEVIILMSDGLNTQNRFSQSQPAIDARELTTCANAKAAGITIYTVQVNTGGDPTMSVMQSCASAADKFTEIKQAAQLVTTFNSIGTALSNLRLAE